MNELVTPSCFGLALASSAVAAAAVIANRHAVCQTEKVRKKPKTANDEHNRANHPTDHNKFYNCIPNLFANNYNIPK